MEPNLGERVRIEIPTKSDPDFEFHGEHGVVLDIVEATCPCGYGVMYRVALDDHEITLDVHPWDIRPSFSSAKHETQRVTRA